MTKYLDTFFEHEHLMELQGYRLQVFASGRVKLSFPDVGNRSTEYYAEWPKRDTEAYRRQHKRSVEHSPQHFDLVDTLRTSERLWMVSVCQTGRACHEPDNDNGPSPDP